MNTSNIATILTSCQGAAKGQTFCDTVLIGDLATAAIQQIAVWHDNIVYALEVEYTWGDRTNTRRVKHGVSDDPREVLDLKSDEFITGVEGYSDDVYVRQLTFVTNKRKWGPYGDSTGERFQWGEVTAVRATEGMCMRMIAVSGRAGDDLRMLQGIFVEQQVQSVTGKIKYEGIPPVSWTRETNPSRLPLSSFTSHLMTPVIRLCIGEERVGLHAHEDTLCKLPFFRAALQGTFRESQVESIDLPEDELGAVSALIEYLYTGNYTYAYNCATTPEPENPRGTLAEGRYHVGVFVIASKYDCQGLGAMAENCFAVVLPQLDTIDRLHLWRAAYVEGSDMSKWRSMFRRCEKTQGVAWVRDLVKNYAEELERTVAELSQLSVDLLWLATGGEE